MECPNAETLKKLLKGHLDHDSIQQLDTHLDGCSTCNQVIQQFKTEEARRPVVAATSELENSDQCPTVGYANTACADHVMPRIQGYDILGVLGQGGMGIVYKAKQASLKRLVALKMIRGVGAEKRERDRFRREAEAIAQLRHPNIVHIYEIGEHSGQPFFSLEYVAGGTLASYIQGKPQFPEESARIVETLARAMEHCHQKKIAHRDLKPGNVLLDPGERTKFTLATAVPKITDFGLAKRVVDDDHQTGTDGVVGTPSYMAPEQAIGKASEIGRPADIYALGAILYELLTGIPPFRGATKYETMDMVVTQDPVPPSRLGRQLPTDLDTICLKCLAKNAEARYATAEALADDLRRYLNKEPVHAKPASLATRISKWRHRHPVVAAALAISATAVIMFMVGSLWFIDSLNRANADLQEENIALEKSREVLTDRVMQLEKALQDEKMKSR